MDVSIRQFYYFVTVCKYMSYTKAARELYITQPALSASIFRLEEFMNQYPDVTLTESTSTPADLLERLFPEITNHKKARHTGGIT